LNLLANTPTTEWRDLNHSYLNDIADAMQQIYQNMVAARKKLIDMGVSPDEHPHQFTGDGHGVSGADNCQHVNDLGVQCGRWYEDGETYHCKDKL
jgi:hypothetical protein